MISFFYVKNVLFSVFVALEGRYGGYSALASPIHAPLYSALLSAPGAELYGLHQGAPLPLLWLSLANMRHWQENRGQEEKERG